MTVDIQGTGGSGVGGTSYWDRTGTTLSPVNVGDMVTVGTYDESSDTAKGTRIGLFTGNSAVQTQVPLTTAGSSGVYDVYQGTNKTINFTAGGSAKFVGAVSSSATTGTYATLQPTGTLQARGANNLLECRNATTGADMVVVTSAGGITSTAETGGNKDIYIKYDQGGGILQDRIHIRGQANSGYMNLFNGAGGATINLSGENGDVRLDGALSKGSGSFKISHPLPALNETHNLVHSFIEGPQADNLYRGEATLVNGTATVDLDVAGRMTPGTFVLLNTNVSCFTSNETDWTPVRGSVSGSTLTIEAKTATSTATVHWLVIGERHDQHMLDTEWTDENGRVITEPTKGA